MNLQPHHTALSVRDIEESANFYMQLGYQEVHRFSKDDNTLIIVHLKLGESFLELFCFSKNKSNQKLTVDRSESLGIKHIALTTTNIKDTLVTMKKNGLAAQDTEITHGKTDIEYFFIQDPDGIWIEVVEDKRGY